MMLPTDTTHLPIEAWLTVPPTSQPGICAICRGIDYTGGRECGNCHDIAEQLAATLTPAWPASAYRKPSQLRDLLTHYKPNLEGPINEEARSLLAQVLHNFVTAIPERLLGPVDVVTTVPSTVSKDSPHPLLQLSRAATLPASVRQILTRGVGELGHGKANREAYAVLDESLVNQRRVLLIDDVYTTGARAQSAAFALRSAGAASVRLIVLARRYNLGYHDRVRDVWKDVSEESYSYKSAVASIATAT